MYPKSSLSHIYFWCKKHTFEKKDSDEVRKKNYGDQRNCENRLEKEIKKNKFFLKKSVICKKLRKQKYKNEQINNFNNVK